MSVLESKPYQWHIEQEPFPDGRKLAFVKMIYHANAWMIEGFRESATGQTLSQYTILAKLCPSPEPSDVAAWNYDVSSDAIRTKLLKPKRFRLVCG